MFSLTQHSLLRSAVALAIAGSVALFGFVQLARADVDPAGCTATGGFVILTTYRADGTTPVGGGTVTDGELIKYKASIGSLPSPVCAFQGGSWSLTTPDGVAHDITPGGGIPRIGGSGVTSIDSALVSYTVIHANEIVNSTRHVDATTAYSGGISHRNANDDVAGPTLGTTEQTIVTHAPVVATNVHDSSHAAITHAAIGATVHDNATVTGESGGPAPTGTVDFKRFNNTACSGDPANTQSGVALSGNIESNTTTVPNTGMSYMAHYNGDGNYSAADGICEPLTADKLTPGVSTDIHNASEAVVTSVGQGSTVHDSATVTGSGPVPTGTVDFTFYENGSCFAEIPASAGSVALASGVAHPSNSEGPLAAGSYSFKAHYNGDANYLAGDAQCEPLTVIAKGHIIVDKVTNPSGDATSFAFTAGGTGYSSFNLTDAAVPNDQMLDAGNYSVSEGAVTDWDSDGGVCVSSNQNVETPGSISLQAGETVTCTFHNTKRAHIIVDKVTNPSGSSQSFAFVTTGTGYNGFSLTDTAAPNNQSVVPGTYTVAETLAAGWDLNGGHPVCIYDGESAGNAIANGEQLVLDAGDVVTCTFTNTQQKGHLIVQKTTVPGGDPTVFSILASGSGTITGGGAGTVTDALDKNYEVTAGTYSVAETGLGAGWSQTSNTCTNVSVAAGETKTCLIVNTFAVQYCSPGYWKQSQHYHSYVTYTPNTLFSDVFENAFPGKTLVQVLSQGGGGLNMLGRATVGALLNATSLQSGMTAQQVINIFNGVFPGGDYNGAASQFTAPENCPLN